MKFLKILFPTANLLILNHSLRLTSTSSSLSFISNRYHRVNFRTSALFSSLPSENSDVISYNRSSLKSFGLTDSYCDDYGYAKVYIIPMFSDNYGYFIVDKKSNKAAAIDVGQAEPMIKAIKLLKLNITSILCTHKHSDHIGGNIALKELYPNIKIIGPKYESIPAIDECIEEGSEVKLGDISAKVIFTPCHTKGHVVYHFSPPHGYDASICTGRNSSPILFSGDTLFSGSCGKFFEGSAEDMLDNLNRISKLPDNTAVYCGHEYTESNFKFLASVDSELCNEPYTIIKSTRRLGLPTVPTTIGFEKKYNLFLKCNEERVQRLIGGPGYLSSGLGSSSAVSAMDTLRTRKNSFQ